MGLKNLNCNDPKEEGDICVSSSRLRNDDMDDHRTQPNLRAPSKLACSPEDRRRRVLERGEERIRRILGNTLDEEEVLAESSIPTTSLFVPETPRNEVTENEHDDTTNDPPNDFLSELMSDTMAYLLSEPQKVNDPLTDQVSDGPREPIIDSLQSFGHGGSYSFLLLFYAVLVKLTFAYISPRYSYGKCVSYVAPFLIVEFGQIISNFFIKTGDDGQRTSLRLLKRMRGLQIFRELCLYPLFEAVGHFALYFTPLCLMEEFTVL